SISKTSADQEIKTCSMSNLSTISVARTRPSLYYTYYLLYAIPCPRLKHPTEYHSAQISTQDLLFPYLNKPKNVTTNSQKHNVEVMVFSQPHSHNLVKRSYSLPHSQKSTKPVC